MNDKQRFSLVLASGIALSLILTLIISTMVRPGPGGFEYKEIFHSLKIFLTSLNTILIGALVWNYVTVYREAKNKFTFGLIVVSLSLFLYALSSSPLFHRFFGFRGSGLGPFQVIPNLFSLIAVTVLLYQSFD